MEKLTYERAVELAREVVAEFGREYVYPVSHKKPVYYNSLVMGCVYVHDEKPSCIVGQILHRHGMSIEELKTYEHRGAWSILREDDADVETLRFLNLIQDYQDGGTPWGEAMDQALNVVSV